MTVPVFQEKSDAEFAEYFRSRHKESDGQPFEVKLRLAFGQTTFSELIEKLPTRWHLGTLCPPRPLMTATAQCDRNRDNFSLVLSESI